MIGFLVFNVVFNIDSVIAWRTVHLFMPSCSSLLPALFPKFFPSHWLPSHIGQTFIKTMNRRTRGNCSFRQTPSSILGKNIGRAVDRTSDLLCSSSMPYRLNYTGLAWSDYAERPRLKEKLRPANKVFPSERVFFYLPWIISQALLYPFPKRQILDFSKLRGFADGNFKFDENVRMFSQRVENTVGKVEIAHYEQFLLFPKCFPKTCTADTLKPGLVWNGFYIKKVRL